MKPSLVWQPSACSTLWAEGPWESYICEVPAHQLTSRSSRCEEIESPDQKPTSGYCSSSTAIYCQLLCLTLHLCDCYVKLLDCVKRPPDSTSHGAKHVQIASETYTKISLLCCHWSIWSSAHWPAWWEMCWLLASICSMAIRLIERLERYLSD